MISQKRRQKYQLANILITKLAKLKMSNYIEELVKRLENNDPSLTTLALSSKGLRSDMISRIAIALKNNKYLISMDLQKTLKDFK